MSPPRLRLALLVLLALLTAACDLGTKRWAEQTLSDPAPPGAARCERDVRTGTFRAYRPPRDGVVVVSGALELRYAENCAGAFGLLYGAPGPVRRGALLLGALAAAIALWWTARQRGLTLLQTAGLGFAAGGGLGNLTDRLTRVHVVDFIHAHWRAFDWPVFNVADIAIGVGVGLLLLASLRAARPPSGSGDASAAGA